MELIYLLIIIIIIFFIIFYLNNHQENFLISHSLSVNKNLFEFDLTSTINQKVVMPTGVFNLNQYYIYNQYKSEKYYLTRVEIGDEDVVKEKHYLFIKPNRNKKYYCDIFTTYGSINDVKKDMDIIPNVDIQTSGKVKLSTDISINKITPNFFTDNNFRLRKHRQYIDDEEENIYSDEFDFNIHKYPTNNNDNLYIIKYIDKTTNTRYYLKNLIRDQINKKHQSINKDINIYLTDQEEFDNDLHNNNVELYLMEIKPFYKKNNFDHIIFGNDDCN